MDKSPAALVIGARLLEALNQEGMSQRELARRLAGSKATHAQVETFRRYVSRWCAGDARPSPKNAARLARELHTPADHFRVGAAEAANVIAGIQDRVASLEAELSRLQA